MATNKPQEQAAKIVDFFGYMSLLDGVFGSDEGGSLDKEDIIRQSLKSMQIKGRCLLVGDTTNDAIGAKKSGVDFIGVLYGFGFHSKEEAKKHGAVFVADRPDSLLKYIV